MQECGHLLEQRLLFKIGEFTCIKIHTMLGTRLVTNTGLIGVFDVFHGLAASWASAICDLIIGFSSFGVARVEEFRYPLVFELLCFAYIESESLAAGASVNRHITAVSGFFHRSVTFWAIHLGSSISFLKRCAARVAVVYCSIPKLRVLCSGSSAGLLGLAGARGNAGSAEKAGLRKRVLGFS